MICCPAFRSSAPADPAKQQIVWSPSYLLPRMTARYRHLIALCRDSLLRERVRICCNSPLAHRIKLKLMESVTDSRVRRAARMPSPGLGARLCCRMSHELVVFVLRIVCVHGRLCSRGSKEQKGGGEAGRALHQSRRSVHHVMCHGL